ncbi:glycosyltransferase family 1 protein [Marasmius fiardii PR-910]|nr:glycosyltransferase family 1 protein [Marasmius fiardii PR-910]
MVDKQLPPIPLHMQELDDKEDFPAIYHDGKSLNSAGDSATGSRASLFSRFVQFTKVGRGLESRARLERDGSIAISLTLKKKLPDLPVDHAQKVQEFAVDGTGWRNVPKLNIVIMIVGSRGDVQPYVALGKKLREEGHRVRIATHLTFGSFVEDHGLEFFDVGGDPKDLMSYMVKNPGLMPGMESLTNGDISRKRKMLAEMINGCWQSCYLPCPSTGRAFAADAIISNPPAFSHVHCAEALGIPLQLTFTMPWTPTIEFHHPLVNIQESNAKRGMTNYLSYALADILTWQGMGDIVNKFRTRQLNLKPLAIQSGPSYVDNLKVPWTYCMSPALVPKPRDWKNHVDVVGFYFLDLATSYTPPDDLVAFLAAGEPPVYIGFGSVVVDDPASMTQTVFEATKKAGVRALVSAGWGGLGEVTVPPHIFILGNIPHDWLFDEGRVAAVVHHGGAGTTSAGLAKGRPTVVVPFFGDQPFWGNMIHRAGAGPAPIPHKDLNADNLCDAIRYAISPGAKEAAARMAAQIRNEDGVNRGVESFYKHLPLKNMRCDLDPSRVAVWWSTKHCLRLSGFAAQVLSSAGELDMKSLDFHRPKEYSTKAIVTDPITGSLSSIYWTVTHFSGGLVQALTSPKQGLIETTTAIPRGTMMTFSSIHKGLHNLPELYGSEVRQEGKVRDLSSGLLEGGKGFVYSLYDGLTGLVTEPYKGAQKEGVVGTVKGVARGVANLYIRPFAGAVGVVKHPFKGAIKSVQALFDEKPGSTESWRYAALVWDGLMAFEAASTCEKDVILKKFKESEADKESKSDALQRTEQVWKYQCERAVRYYAFGVHKFDISSDEIGVPAAALAPSVYEFNNTPLTLVM